MPASSPIACIAIYKPAASATATTGNSRSAGQIGSVLLSSVYANAPQDFPADAYEHFVSDAAEWALGLAPGALR